MAKTDNKKEELSIDALVREEEAKPTVDAKGEAKKKLEAKAKEVFERYKDAKEIYITEDLQAFLDKNPAANHAVKAKKELFTFKRP